MADNSVRTPGSGESIRTLDKSSVKTGVTALDVGGTGTEALVSSTQGMPITATKVTSVNTQVSLASSTTDAQVVASYTSRKTLILTNTDDYRCYVRFSSSAADATHFAFFLDKDEQYEMPPTAVYTGEIRAVWAGDGNGYLIGVEY